MTPAQAARRKAQAGYTLIELIIATTIGLMVMGALTSITVTMMVGANTATSRIEASGQVRNFQFTAYDDFALSRPPSPAGCGTRSSPCTTQDMVLQGSRMPNQTTGLASPYTVRYAWSSTQQEVTRFVGSAGRVVASNVTAFSWFVDTGGDHPTVVINLTVTVGFYNTSYSESQTLRFYPRITAP